jgi:hypothetical protein
MTASERTISAREADQIRGSGPDDLARMVDDTAITRALA